MFYAIAVSLKMFTYIHKFRFQAMAPSSLFQDKDGVFDYEQQKQ